MKIALAQINTTIGDFAGNSAKIIERITWAEKQQVDLLVFPELAICGYPPKDLVEHPSFVKKSLESLEQIAAHTKSVTVVLGCLSLNKQPTGRALHNSAALLCKGKLQALQHKTLLPAYDVFDEQRYFEPGNEYNIHKIAGKKIGFAVCEDIWSTQAVEGRIIYSGNPIDELVQKGAEIIVSISASPYNMRKPGERKALLTKTAKQISCPIVYCNAVGGNDELIFDGHSLVANESGDIVCEGKRFAEDSFIFEVGQSKQSNLPEIAVEEELRQALLLGLKDYVEKCDFSQVVVGLSGGIDSAVVASLAVDALGPDQVTGILMPSEYTSAASNKCASELANNLGIKTKVIPIQEIVTAYKSSLQLKTADEVELAEENLQARIRGNILMAFSNQTGALVLSTGNKSELSVGYCTLYGDMAGGLALISDLPKTLVYRLAKYINKEKEVIPRFIIERPPSAELKPNQNDQDTLPAYEVLDEILRDYVEERMSRQAIIAKGYDSELVTQIAQKVDRNEYKRRQAAPGLRVTSKAFGTGRRIPIAWKS